MQRSASINPVLISKEIIQNVLIGQPVDHVITLNQSDCSNDLLAVHQSGRDDL